jgi:hypothetical protein
VLEHGSQQQRRQAYDQRRGDRSEPPPSPAGSKCNHRRKDATAGARAGWRALADPWSKAGAAAKVALDLVVARGGIETRGFYFQSLAALAIPHSSDFQA